ncbi:hypothetical protein [Marinobacter sp.]|uniref:hypothetical protein n=1 Tax=Marinobacter sp. TaxID=50741 RepID=UPI0035C6EBA4
MEHFGKIVAGLILFIVTSVVAYLFKMRQLYVATPKLYKSTAISKDGSLCEIIIYNRGNQAEEDITASLDPDLNAELLASNSSDLTLEKSHIKINRLHKGQEASAILLIENGILDPSKVISISSKGTQGKTYQKIEEVPPNFALTFLLLAVIFGAIPGVIYGFKAYESLSNAYAEHQLKSIHELGWSNLGNYYDSELKESYSNQEFPVRLVENNQKPNKNDTLTFELYNKTAVPMEVVADKKFRAKGDLSYFTTVTVPPMSKDTLTIKQPTDSQKNPEPKYEFSLQHGDEFIYGMTYIYNPYER